MEGYERTTKDGSARSGAFQQLYRGKQFLCLASIRHGGEAKLRSNQDEVNEDFSHCQEQLQVIGLRLCAVRLPEITTLRSAARKQ